jgi:hypothetical protein
MLFTWLGFAVLSAVLISLAVSLDFTESLADQCRARWADAKLATQWRWGTWCTVYVNGAWVPEEDVHKNNNSPDPTGAAKPRP